MKLNQKQNNTSLSIGDIDAKEFGIDTSNGIIFDILRNKMYSNKIAAVAREISSNSRDANRENNKTNTPIEIHILEPNVLISSSDMQILFKDSGVGITPDRMENVFLNYGASTKRNSNKQTGGFGLGAKTPFAYSDTFTIITICDFEGKRMKYTYTASITDRDGKGSGEMILFESIETNEETGTCIIVPIKESDRSEFEKEIHRATCFWKVQPIFKGFETDQWKFDEIHKGRGFSIIEDPNGRFTDNYLYIIDGIPYEVDRGVLGLKRDLFSDFSYILCFEFKSGDLTISANREAVQYDRNTKIKSLWKIRQIKNLFLSEMNEKFSKQQSYLDACIFINNLNNPRSEHKSTEEFINDKVLSSFYKHYGKVPTYKGRNLINELSLRFHNVYRYIKNPNDSEKPDIFDMGKRKLDTTWSLPIYWLDSNRSQGRTEAILEKGQFILIVPKTIKLKTSEDVTAQERFDKEYNSAIEAQIEEKLFLEELGRAFKNYSEVEPKQLPKKVKDTTVKQTINVPFRIVSNKRTSDWKSSSLNFNKKKDPSDESVEGEYIFVVVNKLSDLSNGYIGYQNLPSVLDVEKGFVASRILDKLFICISKRDEERFLLAKNLSLEQAWKIVETKNSNQIQEFVDNYKLSLLDFPENLKHLNLKNRLDDKFISIMELRKKPIPILPIEQLAKKIGSSIDEEEFKGALTKLYNKYPLLEFYVDNGWRKSDKQIKEMNKIMYIVDELIRNRLTVDNIPLKTFLKRKIKTI